MRISRIIPVYDGFVRAGEFADVFHSFAVCNEEPFCITRRHRIRDVYNPLKASEPYESRLLCQKFDISSGTFTSEPIEIMPVGEDARAITVRGRPYALTSNSPTQSFNYILVDVNERKAVNLEFRGACNLKYGKNWQPFVFEDRLYAIHGFSPFRILEIDPDTGSTEVVCEDSAGLDLISPHDKYTHFRGGGSALVLDDEVVGFAHFTIDSGRHMLFQWRFSPLRRQLRLAFDVDVRFLTARGLNIIDPTSFFRFRNKFYLGLSCSNRDWFYGQTHTSLLLELCADRGEPSSGSLVDFLKHPNSPSRRALGDESSQTVHFFRAAELFVLNGAIGRNFEVHWTAGKDAPGFVIHGPYIDLTPGKYRLRLQYSSPAGKWQEVGYWEVCCNSSSGQTVLAKQDLRGTQGDLAIVELSFEIAANEQGRGIETRVVATGASNLRITDVAIASL